jgi:hypothetical protein
MTKFFCFFGVHDWVYGPVYMGKVNGYLATYHVQNKVCTCCGKAGVVFADGGSMQ